MTKRERVQKLTERFNAANLEAIHCATVAEYNPIVAEQRSGLMRAEERLSNMRALVAEGAVDFCGVLPKTTNIVKRAWAACGLTKGEAP